MTAFFISACLALHFPVDDPLYTPKSACSAFPGKSAKVRHWRIILCLCGYLSVSGVLCASSAWARKRNTRDEHGEHGDGGEQAEIDEVRDLQGDVSKPADDDGKQAHHEGDVAYTMP
jgi:hypothetical protein